MSKTLFILRGLPASGKSTYAQRWVSEDPENRARVNRDDLRFSLFGSYVLPNHLEDAITKAELALVKTLLNAGKSVIVDDQNLRAKYIKPYLQIAQRLGATVIHKDFPVDIDVLLERDKVRERQVGEKVILNNYKRYTNKGKLMDFPVLSSDDLGFEVYVPDETLSKAYIFDIDGTLAHMTDRGPFDWGKVINDLPNMPVVKMARNLSALGYKILVTSGRDAVCREDTALWLEANDVPFDALFMRPEGDMRKDSIIKLELFNEFIRHEYNVLGVFDDRHQVVKLWFELGVPTFGIGDPELVF
jgi:predicted kinase